MIGGSSRTRPRVVPRRATVVGNAAAALGVMLATTLTAVTAAAGGPLASAASRAVRATPRSVSVPGIQVLTRIACPTTTACVSVGGSTGNGATAVIKVATGSVARGPDTVPDGQLNAVACPTGSSCLAVADDAVIAVSPVTGAAQVVAAPAKPAAGIDALGDLACAGAGVCYAVGFEGTEATSHAVVVALSSSGRIEKTTLEAGTGSAAVACPTSTKCLLADNIAHQLYIQLLVNGVVGASHALPPHTYVEALSCFGTGAGTAAGICYALGGESASSSSSTNEVLPVNPATGAVGTPVAIGGHFSGTSLACVSATICLVAGFLTGTPATAALVIVNHGKPSAPAHYPGQNLDGVACATATACFAVGLGPKEAIVDRVNP
ncbi:MAG TPA: hypothetical protein VMD28_04155 [Acidimicrobiales bacterium]|nr:hypothetical protein [Acidimicrobiales bacterium]